MSRVRVNKHIKKILKEAREKKGLTQVEAAEELGISFMHYNRIENGWNYPSPALAFKMSELFNVDHTLFFSK